MDARAEPPEKEGAYPEPNMFGVIPAYGLFCRHVRGLSVRDVTLAYQKLDKRPPVVLEDVQGAAFEKFHARRHDQAARRVLSPAHRGTPDPRRISRQSLARRRARRQDCGHSREAEVSQNGGSG